MKKIIILFIYIDDIIIIGDDSDGKKSLREFIYHIQATTFPF